MTTKTTDEPRRVYIVQNLEGRHPYLEVYQLDHDTKHCLFVVQRGGIRRLDKCGKKWFSSEAEAAAFIRRHIDHKIKMLESQLKELRELTSVVRHRIPPEPPVKGDIITV